MLDCNASAAARRAGYSEATAYAIGHALLNKIEIATAIAEAMQGAAQRNAITVDRIVQQLERWAFGDTRRLASWDDSGVRLHDSETLTDDDAAMVVEVSEKTGQYGSSFKIKRVSPDRALELLMKYRGMLREGGVPDDGPPEPKQIVFTVVDASVPADDVSA